MDSFDPTNFETAQDSPINPSVENYFSGFQTTDEAYLDAKVNQVVGDYSVVDAYKYVNRKLEQSGTDNLLNQDDANAKYGIEGHLKFDHPVNEAYAKDLYETKQKQLYNEFLLSNGTGSATQKWGGGALGVGLSFADPSNLALAFVPVLGEARYAQLLGRAGKAAIGAEALDAAIAGRATLLPGAIREAEVAAGGLRTAGARFVTGAANNAGGALLTEPLKMSIRNQEQTDYEFGDILTGLLEAGLVGGTLHAGIGAFADFRRESQIRSIIGGMREETHVAAQQGAISDLVNDRDVSTPSEIMKLDENVHLQEAAASPEMAAKYPDVVNEVRNEFRESFDNEAPSVGGGKPPRSGLVPANIGEDGKIYYGKTGEQHFNIAERYNVEARGQWKNVGFADSSGRFLSREEAAARVQAEGGKLHGSDKTTKELDALNYKDSGHATSETRELRKQAMRDDVRKIAETTKAQALKDLQAKASQPKEIPTEKPTDAPMASSESKKIDTHENLVEEQQVLEIDKKDTESLLNDYKDSFSEKDHAEFDAIDKEIAEFNADRAIYETAFNCGLGE